MLKKLFVRAGLPSLGLLAVQAHAAVPAEVTTALGDVKADIATLGGLVFVIIIAIAGWKYMRRGV